MRHIDRLLTLRKPPDTAAGREGGEPARIAVIGAGLMGSGIAHVCAIAGLDTILVDTSLERVAGAIDRIGERHRSLLARQPAMPPVEHVLSGLRPAADVGELGDRDLVIEAVFEDMQVKTALLKQVDAVIRPDAIFASNTSTIPITALGAVLSRPDNFIGLHFFSPVERMPLLEIIRGRATSDRATAAAAAFARRIGKTTITVNDRRGFYTTRIVIAYIEEANQLLVDGYAPETIEQGARQAGMPMGPLALCDDVALDLMHRINVEGSADPEVAYGRSSGAALLAALVEKHGRLGRKVGKGYYDYPSEGSRHFWPGLAGAAATPDAAGDAGSAGERLVMIQVMEALRCLEQGVLTDPVDGDIGALLGWGMPEAIGGPFSYIDRRGARNVLETARRLRRLGERFAPTPTLVRLAEANASFIPELSSGS